jgi:hypothetical protein
MKPALYTLLYYATAFLGFTYFNKISPSGPCTLGMGAFLMLLLVPTSIVLFIISIVKSFRSSKHWLGAVFVHIALFCIACLQ